VLWLLDAAIGDVPTAILACVGIVLGVLAMARGRRADGAGAARSEDVSAAPASAPVARSVPEEPAAPPAPAVGHGPIRLVRRESEPQRVAADPAPQAPPVPGPSPDPDPAPDPASGQAPAPAPPRFPEEPATNFRQGRIRVGGLERGRPLPPDE
jgi:hypothetical protein